MPPDENITHTSPLAVSEAPIIETSDIGYKQAVARNFALQLRNERRRAILHRIYLGETVAMGICTFIGLILIGSSSSGFAVMRGMSLACMVLIVVTAAVQMSVASQKNPDI